MRRCGLGKLVRLCVVTLQHGNVVYARFADFAAPLYTANVCIQEMLCIILQWTRQTDVCIVALQDGDVVSFLMSLHSMFRRYVSVLKVSLNSKNLLV